MVFPTSFQVHPVPDEYAGNVTFEVVVEVAHEVGAGTMENLESDGTVSTWLVVPVENREFYRLLEERLASRGLLATVRLGRGGLQIGN
jgi:hypothetical protein